MVSINRLMQFNIREVPGLPNVFVSATGTAYRRVKGPSNVLVPRKGYQGKNGYLVVGVDCYPHYIHRLVADAFLTPALNGNVVRHLDGNKLNNSVENLLWGTQRENCQDTERHGRNPKGTQRYNAKLTDDAVLQIRELWKAGVRSPVIAKRFGISHSHARDIGNRKKWNHI
ncbi:HNH endonuclease signature motif containing protein [Fimbriiglobus ruber]|uniref:HNH endonuclease signature motif containing protein n=1 Tax=Fimbriiglobus ruber TaxID=1908690 RepID=UPI001179A0AF|nr:HNH endonuclease signature motif containing protein [Fimbriiglobus ruber]